MHKSQKGFTTIEAVILLVSAGIIGLAGWYVLRNEDNSESNSTVNLSSLNEITNSEIPKDWVNVSRSCFSFYLPRENNFKSELSGCSFTTYYDESSDSPSKLDVVDFDKYSKPGYSNSNLTREVKAWKQDKERYYKDFQVKSETDLKLDGKLAHRIVYSTSSKFLNSGIEYSDGEVLEHTVIFVPAHKTYGGDRGNGAYGFIIKSPYDSSDGTKEKFDKLIATWRWK